MVIVLGPFRFGSFYPVLVRFICAVAYWCPFPPVSWSISMGHTCFSVPCPGVFPWTHTSCSHHANISSSSCLLVTTHLFPWGVYVGLEFPGPLVLGLCSALAASVQHLPRTDPFYVGELFIALTLRRCQAPAVVRLPLAAVCILALLCVFSVCSLQVRKETECQSLGHSTWISRSLSVFYMH